MVVGASQHHVAVAARLVVLSARHSASTGSQWRYFIPGRQYSSGSRLKQQNQSPSNLSSLPDAYFSKEAHYPDITFGRPVNPRTNQDTVDLSRTRPAQLQSPPSLDAKDFPATNGNPPFTDRAKHLFKIGKSYLAFYKAGFSNLWNNYKQAKIIRRGFAPHSLDTIAKYGGQVRSGGRLPTISRAEYQFCVRTRHDLFKLIPFSMVFAICGEFTPIVIIAAGTSIVPYTCRIPKQESKDIRKKIERENHYMRSMAKMIQLSESAQQETLQHQSPTWRQEWLDAYRYNLTSFSQPPPLLGYPYHKYILRPRLEKHCNNLLCSTILIRREGNFNNLDARSIFEWADKYALHALHEYINNHIAQANRRSDTIAISDLCTEDMKRAIAPACNKEMSYILDQDWTRLDPKSHWRTTYRSNGTNNDRSPDTIARGRQIQTLKQQISNSTDRPSRS